MGLGQSPPVHSRKRYAVLAGSPRIVIEGNNVVITDNARHCGLRPATTITDNNPSLRAMRVIAGNARHCGLRPANDSRRKKNVEQQRPPLRTKPHRCGQCASLRAPTRKPSSRTTTHHYGQQLVVAGNAHYCGLRPAIQQQQQKNVKQPTLTITDKAPSLRALRVIAGSDPQTSNRRKKTSDNNVHHYGQRPVVAGNARHCGQRPANNSRRKKNVKQPTPTITDKAPSLRAMRVIAGNDPQYNYPRKKSVKQQRPPLRTTTRRCGLRPATPQLTAADAKKASNNNAHHYGQSPVVAGDPQPPN
jgi:hypothetical protein